MMQRVRPILLVLCTMFWPMATQAQWADVAPGISYREFTLDGPVRVFVARADRSKTNWVIDTAVAKGKINKGMETVPDQVARYNDSVTFDGRRYEIKVAINGDYYNMSSGTPLSGQIVSGWFAKRFGDYTGSSGFVWTADRRCFLGGNLRNEKQYQQATFADGAEMKIQQLNMVRGPDELALYTCHFDENTGTPADGVEVVVRLSAPLAVLPPAGGVKGQIIQVRPNAGSTPLLFDQAVLSAQGQAAAQLGRHAREGQEVSIELNLQDFGHEEIGMSPQEWRGAYASLGGPCCCLVNGVVPRHWEKKAERLAKEGKKHGSVVKDPRTLVAYNEKHVYFLVIDGRSKESIGMTFTEAGTFCKEKLEATNATLQDGGGSSTLWVDGKVMNTPSGKIGQDRHGALRAVSNGFYIALVHPPRKSLGRVAGMSVRLPGDAELRLGPGTQYGTRAKVPAGQTVRLGTHMLNGIKAKGTNWWNCVWDEAEGWIAERDLRAAATRPDEQ